VSICLEGVEKNSAFGLPLAISSRFNGKNSKSWLGRSGSTLSFKPMRPKNPDGPQAAWRCNVSYFRAAHAYMLISIPTGTSTIFGAFQVIFISPGFFISPGLRRKLRNEQS